MHPSINPSVTPDLGDGDPSISHPASAEPSSPTITFTNADVVSLSETAKHIRWNIPKVQIHAPPKHNSSS